MDVVEIDAASNNSVDNIRRITDEVVFLPAITKYKVYIIDEVHMLSMGAFNALLKTLEEPPAHVVFMLATTEVHRIPATITSRCQRFDFRRISLNAITERLRKVATEEDIDVDQGALHEMAVQSDGALRDALSLLDQSQMAITGTITRTSVRELIGVVDTGFIGRLAGSLAEADAAAVLQAVDTVVMEGKDIVRFTADLAGYYRNLMICKSCSEPGNLLLATPEEISQMQTLAARYEQPEIVAIIKALSKLLADLKWITNPRTLLEVTLLSLAGTRRQPFGATGTASGNSPFARRSFRTRSGACGSGCCDSASGRYTAGRSGIRTGQPETGAAFTGSRRVGKARPAGHSGRTAGTRSKTGCDRCNFAARAADSRSGAAASRTIGR